jgi:arylesterase / paraoxonase
MKKILILLGLLLVIGHFTKILIDSGQFRQIQNQGFGSCNQRAEIPGAEDMEYSTSQKLIFVSSDNRPQKGEKDKPSGGIYVFSPENTAPALLVSPALPFPFHPHGLSLWEEGGNTRLFVVNHRPEESTIEVFDWLGGQLIHVRSYSHDVLITPNDILATGAEEFFVSHDHGSRSHFAQTIEHFSRFGRGYLTRYDGTSFFVVDSGISFANGLALDRAKKILYLAAMLEKAVRVYDLSNLAEPKQIHRIDLSAAPDNLSLGPDGTLWVAAHPRVLTLKSHSETHSYPSPSLVIKIKNPSSREAIPKEVMIDEGKIIPAASIALPAAGKLYLGAIYDPRVLVCDLPRAD